MKKISLLFLLFVSSICLFTACNSPSSVTGAFLSKEYVLSLGEVEDFYAELEVKGVDKARIELTSTNENIISSYNGEDFVANSSGNAYIFARYKNKVVAKAKVSVRYKFSSPQNIEVSEEGVLTWDASYAVVNGKKVSAKEYHMEVGQIVDANTEISYDSFSVFENKYTFPKKASYSVKITALADNENDIEASEEIEKVFHNGVMGALENVQFEINEEFASQEATLSWDEKVDAVYDIYVEGFKLENNLEQSYYTFNYSIYQGGEEVSIEIIAKDKNGEKISSSTPLSVTVLETPEIEYLFNKDGKLSWNVNNNVSAYMLRILDYEGNVTYQEITDITNLDSALEGYDENIYDISIVAVGGEKDGYFGTSKESVPLRACKIAVPKVSIEFVDNKANVTFSEDSYVTDYKISWSDHTVYYSVNYGYTSTLDMTGVPVGGHTIEIVALPKADAESKTGVAEYSYKDDASNKVLNSNKVAIDFYVLEQIDEVTHVLNDNLSTFTFDSVANANFYKIYVNDELIDDAVITEDEGLVTCKFENLKNYAPKDNGYDIKIIAGRLDFSTGKEVATRSEIIKRLQILDVAEEEDSQVNGSFAWKEIAQPSLYTYMIYKTQSDYALVGGQEPIYTNENIDALTISETLEEGYYKIRIISISEDNNLYLDSNFNNPNNILEVNFFVTQVIESPTAEFYVEDGKYKLTISTVDFASLYEVYVDGILDGQVASEGLASEEYIFSSTFYSAEKHEVKVKALAGTKFDGNIYKQSNDYQLNVTRLTIPQYYVEIVYTDFDSENHEWLNVYEIENSTKVKFELNGVEVSSENYRLDMANYDVYGTNFKVGMTFIAGENNGNEYYIDSHIKEVEFKRASYPTQIKYSNGKLSWNQVQTNAEKNYISLIVDTASGSDYYKRFESSSMLSELNIQTYINNLRASDLSFETAYRQVEKLQVKMLSYLNSNMEKYYLPSFYGTTAKTGTNTLEIKLLQTPSLEFDVNSKIISWDYETENVVFDIYVDDALVKEGYDLAKSISLADLGTFDFTTQKKINICARGEEYLNSDISSPIYIKQLVTPSSINIAKDGSEYRASILINSDSANVEKVNVNGSSTNVNYTQGSNIASFVFSDFPSTTSFAINLLAKNEGTLNYYISSQPITYELKNLSDETFNAKIDDLNVVWNTVADDFVGNNLNPVRYILTVKNQGKTFTKVYTNETNVDLNNLESVVGEELFGEVEISVKAIINEDYTLSSIGATPLGYYGENEITGLVTNKLSTFSNVEIVITDGSGATNIERKINSILQITFDDLWSSFADVYFDINIVSGGNTLNYNLSSAGVTHTDYSFKLSGSSYIFQLNSTIVKSLVAGEIEFSIQAHCKKQISSNIYSSSFEKFNTTQNAVVYDNGILEVNDSQANASYLVEIAIEDATLEASILLSEGNNFLNLMKDELILHKFGAYTIKLLTFSEENLILPANEVLTISGYKLQGIENVFINDEGDIVFEIYMDYLADVVFSAKCQEFIETISPTLVEGESNIYTITMLELLEVFKENFEIYEDKYDFSFAVRSVGSIDSDWVDLSFNYAIDQTPVLTRGATLDKDYIIYQKSDKSDTVSFNAYLTAIGPVETEVDGEIEVTYVEQTKRINISASSVFGYWVTDLEGNNGFFTTTKGTSPDVIYTECYVISVNELLKDAPYGFAKISISRIGKSGEVYYQYNQSEFEVYKLNKINDAIGNEGALQVKDNYLTFSWQQLDENAKDIVPTAYYIIFENTDGEQIKRITNFVCSLDLRTAGLTQGESYTIKIVAVSAERNIIASDLSVGSATLRYTTPLALQVEDGILTFNKTDFLNTPFMQDIITYFAQTTESEIYHNQVGLKQYTVPYYFTPSLLDELYVTIRFTKLDNVGGVTNQVYTMTILGYWLFPDLNIDFELIDFYELGKEKNASYFYLLERYKDIKLNGVVSSEASAVSSMVDALKTSPKGIGDNAVLFDDLGRNIPAGDYLVNIIQTKSNHYVESEGSEAVKMYLSAAPEITLQTEEVDAKTEYVINLTPAATMVNDGSGYVASAGMRYKLSLRPTDRIGYYSLTGNLELIIMFDGSSWTISYGGTLLDGIISNNEKTNLGLCGFKINMSKLRRAVNDITGEDTIPANKLMRADIFVYNQDNGYVLNGKSAVFNVKYLDLSAESIKFNDGKFEVESPLDSTYDLLVKYKFASQNLESFTVKFEDGRAVINLEKAGYYSYVVLSLNGSISANTMNIESASYAIADLYKLTAPSLTTSSSNFIINYNTSDTAYMNTLSFNMANDISLHKAYNSPDKGYYYKSSFTRNESIAPYVVGSKDIYGDTIYPSELMASEFYTYLNGNSGEFTLSEETHVNADFLLEFNQTYAILNSDISSIKARMLAYVNSYEIYHGSLYIDDRHVGINIVSDKDSNYLSGNIVFEVSIECYVEDNDNPGSYLLVGTEVFYSERMYADELQTFEQYFDGLNFNEAYDCFKVAVTCVGGLRVDETTPNAVQTVEGTYVLLTDSVYYYGEEDVHVLRSQTQIAPFYIKRTISPYLLADSSGVREGSINFMIDDSIYYAEYYQAPYDTATRLEIYAEYTIKGTTYFKPLSGTISFTPSMISGEEGLVYCSFIPSEGLLNDIVGSFKIYIYASGKDNIGYNAVISRPLIISDIYKLSKIENKYYNVGINDEGYTYIDFTKYFANISINNDNKCFKIVINYVVDGVTYDYTLTSEDAIKRFIIPVGTTNITFQAQDGQSEMEANPKKLLYSDTSSFDIEETDDTALELSWNAKEMRFEWSWSDGNTNTYEYFVSITINGRTTTEIITTNYYLPKDRGLISSGGFEVRARKVNDVNSGKFSTFSDGVTYLGEEIRYELFSGGNGSQSNPYLISTKEDFLNISKRNTNEFYFKLINNNISINVKDLYDETGASLLMQDFNAHFNGDGFAIEFISSDILSFGENYNPNLIGKSGVSFSEYSSLFRNITTNATVSNLLINYVIDYDDLDASSILFSPLCAFNYGTIDGVKVLNVTINELNGAGEDNIALVGGIASVNYGVIKNCINGAEINYIMPQQLSLTFGYAGIALFNANITTYVGSIENCYNQASKSISVTYNNSLVYLAGIALTNSGSISKAGNESALTLSAKSGVTAMTGYYGGIVITNNNGTLEYVYNNAVIENTSNYGTFNYGGIAYTISSGKINTLVVTVSGQPIVKSCTNPPTDLGFNYASSDSGTASNIATRELSAQVVDCGNDYKLIIAQVDGVWKASIAKA